VASPAPLVRPADRYGRTPTPRGRLLRRLAVGLLLAVGVGWAAWAGIVSARTPIRVANVQVSVVDEARVQVGFQVRMAAGRTAVCTVTATNAGAATVGRMDVRVGPSALEVVEVTAEVPTTERARTAQIRACALA
jgi:hypothetical protein